MKCVICKHGETAPGVVTVTLERGGTTIKGVPANVCENCGEQYVDEQITSNLLSQSELAIAAGVQVEVRGYAAA